MRITRAICFISSCLSTPSTQNLLDTLAQSRTEKTINPVIEVFGNGSDLTDKKALNGRTKRKLITQSLTLALIDVAKERGDVGNIQPLWNSYHCLSQVISSSDRLYGRYCKNRFCVMCNAIRKADLINKYLPYIQSWSDPQFLTLTVKSVKAEQLKQFIENGVLRAFKQIKDAQRKRYSRSGGIKLMGVKSLECNFNPKAKTYNPHLHIILPDRPTAELLRNEWIKKWSWKGKRNTTGKSRTYYVNPKAQDLRKVFNNESALVEIIKYGSKIFTEPNPNNKKKGAPKIYASALYNILCAMKGHRLFDRFGFDLPRDNKIYKPTFNEISDYQIWEFEPCLSNWYNECSNELLTDYSPPQELLNMLGTNIDKTAK